MDSNDRCSAMAEDAFQDTEVRPEVTCRRTLSLWPTSHLPSPSLAGTVATAFSTSVPVVVTIAGQTLVATVADGGGTWQVTTGLISDGTYTLRADVTDSDGNRASATQVFTVGRNADLVPLGKVATYSVFGGDGVTSTGVSILSNDLGTSPSSSVVGFPDGIVGGEIHAGDLAAAQARADMDLAYSDARGRTATGFFAGDQNGAVFHASVFHTASAFALTGTLTLDAENHPRCRQQGSTYQ